MPSLQIILANSHVYRYKCISGHIFIVNSSVEKLTNAQNELYEWIKDYIKNFHHSPSIRQMMQAMGLKSPAPIQSRLKHLQEKGFISWQEGKSRTLQLTEEILSGIPILGSIAAGGLIETYQDLEENLDILSVTKKEGVFALRVQGDSMVDAHIADGDQVLMEPVYSANSIKNGTIVSAYVQGLGSTLKYFYLEKNQIRLVPANPNYDDIFVPLDRIEIQGKLIAVWRKH